MRAKDKDHATRFHEAARELGCDDDEAAFDAKLKKVATHKPSREGAALSTVAPIRPKIRRSI